MDGQDGPMDGQDGQDRRTDTTDGRTGRWSERDDGVIQTTGRGIEVQEGMMDRRSERASVCV